MSRLEVNTPNSAQMTVEGLYKDLERRIIASPPGLCPVDIGQAFLKLCHAQTCGKCVPCRIGLGQLSNLLDKVLDLSEDTTLDIIPLIEETAEAIRDSSDCAIGVEAAKMVLKGVEGYRDDYIEHILHHRCTESIAKLKQPVPCVALCPAGVDIPGYNALVLEGRYDDAVRLIRKDIPFPVVCAFICEHPCESRCRRNLIDAPINIRGLKRFAVDNCGDVDVPKPASKTNKKIAVIGGGPSGLTAAYYLSLMGHSVKIFEKRNSLGGMLRYGIPSYRLPRERLQEDIDKILSTDIEVELGTDIGNDKNTVNKLKKEFDAVYISVGSHNHKALGIENEFAKGVLPAVEVLRGIGDGHMPKFTNKEVAVIGCGNVAMDIARTANRVGASKVSILYRRRKDDMTAQVEEVEGAIAEGCELMTLVAPEKIEINSNEEVVGVWVKPQITGEADENGRPKPVDANLEHLFIPCDIIISAIGQVSETKSFEESGVPIERGNIVTASSSQIREIDGMFAGGDCVTGPSTVINAIAAGKVAAANIDNYLGYQHEISVDVDIPAPRFMDHKPMGRVELKLRQAGERGEDFFEIEMSMTKEEACQEASRCLRCDCEGFGAFRGGRIEKW